MCIECSYGLRDLVNAFGQPAADYLLWNETAFPVADGTYVREQIDTLTGREHYGSAALSQGMGV
jgi:hypothetical protein